MKISVAQIKPIKGAIAANIEAHKKLINLAISSKADAIFFPELSLTGYEPTLAKTLATNENDARFDEFQHISDTNQLTIGVGVPTKTHSGIQISMLIFQSYSPRQNYAKQQLHADELAYFINGENQTILTIAHKKVAPAICFESLQPEHSTNAVKLGAEIYVACVAKSQTGVDKAMKHYPEVAKKFSMPVVMSNVIGFCDSFESAGNSAVWTKNGNLAGQLDGKCEGLLIFDTATEVVITQTL
jgi:predicted amidohydrolase